MLAKFRLLQLCIYKVVYLAFAAFKRANGFRKYALVGLGPEWVRAFGYDFKRKTMANYRLAKK